MPHDIPITPEDPDRWRLTAEDVNEMLVTAEDLAAMQPTRADLFRAAKGPPGLVQKVAKALLAGRVDRALTILKLPANLYDDDFEPLGCEIWFDTCRPGKGPPA
jgi:hypothetical protein